MNPVYLTAGLGGLMPSIVPGSKLVNETIGFVGNVTTSPIRTAKRLTTRVTNALSDASVLKRSVKNLVLEIPGFDTMSNSAKNYIAEHVQREVAANRGNIEAEVSKSISSASSSGLRNWAGASSNAKNYVIDEIMAAGEPEYETIAAGITTPIVIVLVSGTGGSATTLTPLIYQLVLTTIHHVAREMVTSIVEDMWNEIVAKMYNQEGNMAMTQGGVYGPGGQTMRQKEVEAILPYVGNDPYKASLAVASFEKLYGRDAAATYFDDMAQYMDLVGPGWDNFLGYLAQLGQAKDANLDFAWEYREYMQNAARKGHHPEEAARAGARQAVEAKTNIAASVGLTLEEFESDLAFFHDQYNSSDVQWYLAELDRTRKAGFDTLIEKFAADRAQAAPVHFEQPSEGKNSFILPALAVAAVALLAAG